MKKLYLILFLAWSLKSSAQIEIYNISLTDSTQRILYRGVENKIVISGIENLSDVKLISSLKSYFGDKNQSNLYYLSPSWEKTDTIKIFVKDSLVLSEKYSCEIITDPIPIFANIKDLYVSIDQIKSNPYLSVILPNCFYKHDFFVVHYDVYFYLFNIDALGFEKRIFKNEKINNYKLTFKKFDKILTIAKVKQIKDSIYVENSVGNIYTKSIKTNTSEVNNSYLNKGHLELINKMQSGDVIVFRDIIIRSINGCDRYIGSLTISIR